MYLCGLQVSHVAWVEEIEDAVRDDNFLAGGSSAIGPCGRGTSGREKHAGQVTACGAATGQLSCRVQELAWSFRGGRLIA